MTRANSVKATGAMAIGMPGWPQPAAWTASIERARTASTQRRSTSGGARVVGAGAVATAGGGFMRLSCRRSRTRDMHHGELLNGVFAPSDNCSARAVLAGDLAVRIAHSGGGDQPRGQGQPGRDVDGDLERLDGRV